MEKVKATRRWRVRIRAVDSRIIWTGIKLDKISRRRKSHRDEDSDRDRDIDIL